MKRNIITFLTLVIFINLQSQNYRETFSFAPILEKPNSVNSKKLGVVKNNKVKILESINDGKYYKVSSNGIVGYLSAVWLKSKQELEEEREKMEKEKKKMEKVLKMAEEAEKRRVLLKKREKERINKIALISEGDQLCYSEDWNRKEKYNYLFGYGTGTRNIEYKMKAVLLVEKVLPNGRIKLIINSIVSSDKNEYSTIKIGQIQLNEGKTIYLTKDKMKNNKGFQFCD